MITIDIDGQLEARRAQIDDIERQLADLAVAPFEFATERFHHLEEKIDQAKAFLASIENA